MPAVLVVADHQVGGRGRSGREWWDAPRALATSVAFRPRWPADTWGRIPLVAGLAAREAFTSVVGITPGLKWPNDLVVPAGKLGGVLSEAAGDVVVVGCGANLWWPGGPEGAAAAFEEDPGPEPARQIAAQFCDRVLAALERGPAAWGHEAYRAACETLGRQIVWDPSGAGEAVDVAADGALVVETPGGRISLHSGEVWDIRPRR
jgi:BirA family biotin operon repressor/biotin-[acetyl-CoA-carboxylase] ligase